MSSVLTLHVSVPPNGFTHYTLNGIASDCLPVTAAPIDGPTISIPTGWQFNPQYCSGPSSIHVEFIGGHFDFNLTYYGGYARTASCYETITSGTLVLD